jgi:hypothetical protein
MGKHSWCMLHDAQLFLIALTVTSLGFAVKDIGWGIPVPGRS